MFFGFSLIIEKGEQFLQIHLGVSRCLGLAMGLALRTQPRGRGKAQRGEEQFAS